MEDAIGGKLHKSLLYKLADNGMLKHFNRVVLVSSFEDMYVPTYSARVQMTAKVLADGSGSGAVLHEMQKAMLAGE